MDFSCRRRLRTSASGTLPKPWPQNPERSAIISPGPRMPTAVPVPQWAIARAAMALTSSYLQVSLQRAGCFDGLQDRNQVAWPNAQSVERGDKVPKSDPAVQDAELSVVLIVNLDLRAS